jgi:hypothetical protein
VRSQKFDRTAASPGQSQKCQERPCIGLRVTRLILINDSQGECLFIFLENVEDQQMPTDSSIHFYLNWAKERIDEMDATLASLESKASEVHVDARVKPNQVLADLRNKRDEFRGTVKKQAKANEAAWIDAKQQLETQWNAFETEVNKYVDSFSKQIEQQHATFTLQSAAQLKAWREAADKLRSAGKEFAAERRGEIEAVVKRMEADAATAEKKLQELNRAGMQSWSALMGALAETRAAFDRANQAAREAFKRSA